jgi:hypothetical protein
MLKLKVEGVREDDERLKASANQNCLASWLNLTGPPPL